jgi:hypothetical protein
MPKEQAKEVKTTQIKKVVKSRKIYRKKLTKVHRFTFGYDYIGLRYSRHQPKR